MIILPLTVCVRDYSLSANLDIVHFCYYILFQVIQTVYALVYLSIPLLMDI